MPGALPAARAVVTAVAVAVLAACSGSGEDRGPAGAPQAQQTGGPVGRSEVVRAFDAAGPTTRAGFRTERCVRRAGTVTLLVPDRYRDWRRCGWGRPMPAFWDGETLAITIGPRTTLREEHEVEQGQEIDGGDAGTGDLAYDDDAAGPGGLRGESLVFTRANDGAPLEYHLVQAGGVRVTWAVPPGTWGRQAAELDVVVASLDLLS